MSDSIVLKTYKGASVTPQDDALIYDAAFGMNGIFKGCHITRNTTNTLKIEDGFGMIKGRFFELYESEIGIQLCESGITLKGRLFIRLDLSNTDEPIQIMTYTGEELPELELDDDININNSVCDMELATFNVTASGLTDVLVTFKEIKSSGSGGAYGLERKKEYLVGDYTSSASAPGWVTLLCIKSGTTAVSEPVTDYSNIENSGDTVTDGSAVFMARNILSELDIARENIDKLTSDTGAIVFKTYSLEDYMALEEYRDTIIYLCFEGDSCNITHIFMGKKALYEPKAEVTFCIDEGVSNKRLIAKGEDALSNAPSAKKEGYEFVGWRTDNEPKENSLSEYQISSEKPVIFYAVFRKSIIISLNSIGEIGDADKMNSWVFYNNGAIKGAKVILPKCKDTKENYTFSWWVADGDDTSIYKAKAEAEFDSDVSLYPFWILAKREFMYTGGIAPYTVPADGLYMMEVFGAQGANISVGSYTGFGGLGGYSKGYKILKKGDVLYVVPGGQSDRFNGGGKGNSFSESSKGGSGGGATHIASTRGELKDVASKNRDSLLIVAGGGGGGYCTSSSGLNGGGGGGLSGEKGSGGNAGGTQVTAGNSDLVGLGYSVENTSYNQGHAGGGGGYYGGTYGTASNSGAGGSGYIDGLPTFIRNGVLYEASTESSVNEGNGRAIITFLEAM